MAEEEIKYANFDSVPLERRKDTISIHRISAKRFSASKGIM